MEKGREVWADFAEGLRVLADKTYRDLQENSHESLSLNRFLE